MTATAVKLFEITAQFKALERLAEGDELPSEVIADTLEGLTGTFNDKAVAVAKMVLSLESTADAIALAAAAMKTRGQAVQHRADRIRAYLQFQMQTVETTRIACHEIIIRRVVNPPAVVVFDESTIPAKFSIQQPPPPPKLDKAALKKALTDGERVDGAYLERGERLEIKV